MFTFLLSENVLELFPKYELFEKKFYLLLRTSRHECKTTIFEFLLSDGDDDGDEIGTL